MTSTKSPRKTQPTTSTSTPSETFGQRLRRLRKKAGLTQEELADKIDVSVMSIRRWEAGDNAPKIEFAKRLAEALGVPQAELLEGSPLPLDHWVLTIRIVDTLKEEVIDLARGVPNISVINTSKDGGLLTLGGSYELWTDDNNFKQLIADLKKYRKSVIQNGIALGGITEPIAN